MSSEKKINLYLSKSLFLKGLQCHKYLYLERYHPELKDEIPESVYAQFQSGIDVGKLARQLFPGGIEMPHDNQSYDEKLAMTQSEMKQGHTLYEPAFSHNNVFIKADIFHSKNDEWELYEVKGGTECHQHYLDDIAVQYYVIKGTGAPLSKAFIVYINNQYVRNGDIEVDKLFTIEDVTEKVLEKQGFVEDELNKMREMLKGDIPAIDIGKQCKKPYGCNFQGHCWKHLPEDSVFLLMGRWFSPLKLYEKGMIRISDVPLDMLKKDQRIQAEAYLNKSEFINKEALKKFLGSLWYPMYFLDFETVNPAIPLFDGTKPYQKVPFQYSLHVLKHENAELEHHEFLAEPNKDQRQELLKKLLDSIPETACVLAYTNFEEQRLTDLASWFPEYQEKLNNIIANIRDLSIPFANRDIYYWQMKGSFSEKGVLPVLVPELSYEGMEVSDGGMAMGAYWAMCQTDDQAEIQRIRTALLEYCKLDTIGMVRLWEKLNELV